MGDGEMRTSLSPFGKEGQGEWVEKQAYSGKSHSPVAANAAPTLPLKGRGKKLSLRECLE